MLAILILVPSGLANRMDMLLLKWERIAIQVVAPIVDVHHSWLSIHRISQGSQTLIGYMWNILYNGLNACNAAIARADGAGLSDDLKKQRLAKYIFSGHCICT